MHEDVHTKVDRAGQFWATYRHVDGAARELDIWVFCALIAAFLRPVVMHRTQQRQWKREGINQARDDYRYIYHPSRTRRERRQH